LLLLFFAHQHKAAGVKLSKMLNNSCKSFLFSVHCLHWTAFPPAATGLWTGVETERLSLVSWVIVVRLPISWTSLTAVSVAVAYYYYYY